MTIGKESPCLSGIRNVGNFRVFLIGIDFSIAGIGKERRHGVNDIKTCRKDDRCQVWIVREIVGVRVIAKLAITISEFYLGEGWAIGHAVATEFDFFRFDVDLSDIGVLEDASFNGFDAFWEVDDATRTNGMFSCCIFGCKRA